MLRIGSLFSGAGGLDMAVEAVFGGEVVWHSEIDEAASKVLAHHWPEVPNLGDISAVGWHTVPTVDILCGGFPCQDVSAAGKRAGIKDGTRSGLWSVFADAIETLRPPIVIIENVRGLLSAKAHRNLESDQSTMGEGSSGSVLRAAGAVLGDLADLRYDAQWATVSAASVGAPHRRERVFIIATDTTVGGWKARLAQPGRPERKTVTGTNSDRTAANTQRGSRAWSTEPGGNQTENSKRRQTGVSRGRSSSGIDRATDWELTQAIAAFDIPDSDGNVDLLPTPVSKQSGNTPEGHLRQKPGRQVVTDLAIIVENGLLETGGALPAAPSAPVAELDIDLTGPLRAQGKADATGKPPAPGPVSHLLPTPASKDGVGGCIEGTLGGQRPSGAKRSVSLATALHHMDGEVTDEPQRELLPTPASADSERGPDLARASRAGSGGDDLVTLVIKATRSAEIQLLCTPSASDGTGGKTSRSGGRIGEPLLGGQAQQISASWGKYGPAIERWEQLTRPAPSPTEPNTKGNPRLSPLFSEWLMGWPAGHCTDPAIGIKRNDQLRIVGNGVCPQQAAAALASLVKLCGNDA